VISLTGSAVSIWSCSSCRTAIFHQCYANSRYTLCTIPTANPVRSSIQSATFPEVVVCTASLQAKNADRGYKVTVTRKRHPGSPESYGTKVCIHESVVAIRLAGKLDTSDLLPCELLNRTTPYVYRMCGIWKMATSWRSPRYARAYIFLSEQCSTLSRN